MRGVSVMKRNTLITSVGFLLLLLFIFNSYGQEKAEWKGKIEVESGVTIVKNPNKPVYGEIKFELEEELSIGNDRDNNYLFYRVRDVTIDSQGNIFASAASI